MKRRACVTCTETEREAEEEESVWLGATAATSGPGHTESRLSPQDASVQVREGCRLKMRASGRQGLPIPSIASGYTGIAAATRGPVHTYLPPSVSNVVLQESIPTRIRQLILYIGNSQDYVDGFVWELTPAQRLKNSLCEINPEAKLPILRRARPS